MRAVLARATERLGAEGQRTILFLDEIHRFNKAQQDALLPAVESGLADADRSDDGEPVLRGQLGPPLAHAGLRARAAHRRRPGRDRPPRGAASLGADVPDELVASIAGRAGGDARTALNILELAWSTAQSEGAALEERHVEDAARRRPVVYDKGGDAHYDFTSAFIKSIRGSDPDAALYYLAAMLEGGEDARYIARRLIVHASEDIGMADSQALLVATAAAHAVEHVGLPEAQLNLAHATIYLANAPRSRTPSSRRSAPLVRTFASTARSAPRSRCGTPVTAARRSSATARATSTRRTTRPATTSTTSRTSSRAGATTSPSRLPP